MSSRIRMYFGLGALCVAIAIGLLSCGHHTTVHLDTVPYSKDHHITYKDCEKLHVTGATKITTTKKEKFVLAWTDTLYLHKLIYDTDPNPQVYYCGFTNTQPGMEVCYPVITVGGTATVTVAAQGNVVAPFKVFASKTADNTQAADNLMMIDPGKTTLVGKYPGPPSLPKTTLIKVLPPYNYFVIVPTDDQNRPLTSSINLRHTWSTDPTVPPPPELKTFIFDVQWTDPGTGMTNTIMISVEID